ncbi:MAG: hypothetical protein M5U31_10330 [Acidimicrobiia bacterium]|nr:hypothetical protein [Acidimicrobiia bacterium]
MSADADSEPYSSTQVRQLLAMGDVEAAARRLGRHHEVRGTVVEGDKRGRDLGFPTANIAVPDEIAMPADGIYAGYFVDGPGNLHQAALSLGRRPTFHHDQRFSLLEAHLLDFDGDLYGQQVAVRFVARIRGRNVSTAPGSWSSAFPSTWPRPGGFSACRAEGRAPA